MLRHIHYKCHSRVTTLILNYDMFKSLLICTYIVTYWWKIVSNIMMYEWSHGCPPQYQPLLFFLLSYHTGPLYLPGVEHGTIIGISSARWKSRLSRHTRDTSLPAAFDLIPRDARAAPYLFPGHVGSPLLLALSVASVSRCSLPPSPWVTLPNYWPVRPLNYWIPTDTSVWIQFCFCSQIIPN